jgi:hypothetical protein
MHHRYGAGVMLLLATGLSLVHFLSSRGPVAADDIPAPEAAAIARARAEVQMLDDLYKNFVVQITATYVGAEENVPAAKVAMKVFRAMHKKGWHNARLVDATGTPVRQANLPATPFEKAAIAQIKSGKTYYDEVGSTGGKKVLRAATVVPVVMKQCITCHQGKKEGDLLGALVYEVPIN